MTYRDNPYEYDDYCDRKLLSERWLRARKDHACFYCKNGIKAGTKYRSQFIVDDEGPLTVKTCDDCVAEEYGIPRPDEVEAMIRADEAEVAG